MSPIKKCVAGETQTVAWVTTPTRRDQFSTDAPPLIITSGGGTLESRAKITVQAHSTYGGYGEIGFTFVSFWIYLPVQRIFFENLPWGGVPDQRCRWFVTDNRGETSRLNNPRSTAHWMWGTGRHYDKLRVIEGEEPTQLWGLHIEDANKRSRTWTSSQGPIPWEVKCGCKASEMTCGSFPTSFCCLNCNSLNSSLVAIERRVEQLTQTIESKARQFNP